MLLEHLVIGSTTAAALHALIKECYFLPSPVSPIFYQQIDTAVLGTKREEYSWSRLQLILAMQGKLLNYEKLQRIKIQNSTLKIVSDQGLNKYVFGTCEIFDQSMVELENRIVKPNPPQYIVYDDFELSMLGGRPMYLEPKLSEEAFASKIYYYNSDRINGASYVTDCVVESTLTKEQTIDFDYSDSMVRFAVIRHLESIGVKGRFIKMYKNGTPKYKKPRVTHKKRVFKTVDNNVYEDTDLVKIRNLNIEEVLHEVGT